jgi:hypothetical protein
MGASQFSGLPMSTLNDFLSLRDIAEQYRGAGTVATWRCRISRNTGGIRSIVRKVGGSIRIQRSDLENYLKPTGETP